MAIFAEKLKGSNYSSTWQTYTNRHQLEFEVDGKIYTVACFGVISADAPFSGGTGATTNKLPQHYPVDNNQVYTNNSGGSRISYESFQCLRTNYRSSHSSIFY